MTEAINLFLQSRSAMDVSDRTLGDYDLFLKVVKREGERIGISEVEEYDEIFIRKFIIIQKDKGLSSYTLNHHWRRFKTFFRFLFDNGYVTFNPINMVAKPQIKKRAPRVFDTDEIFKMMNVFSGQDFISIRNRTIIYTLFSTGLRLTEFSNLSMSDLDFYHLRIYVIGKGNKERYIPIGKQLENFLKQYLRRREGYLNECCTVKVSPFVFIQVGGGKLSQWDVRRMFLTIKHDCGISGRKVSPHTWRHTFATNYVRNGGDIRSLQMILGHSSMKTTEMYLTLSSEMLREQNTKFNPLDNMKWRY